MRQIAVTGLLCCVILACSRDAKLDARLNSSEATPIKELITGSLEHSRDMPSAKRALNLARAMTRTRASQPVATPPKVRRAQGARFAAATAHPLATAEAQAALERGGNAVDALVAASVMLTVVTPHSTGIGGGGFAVVWPGGGKPAQALDFREEAPAAGRLKQYLDATGRHVAKRSQRHGLAIGVPGYVAGLWALHKRWGKLPWASLFARAIDVAHKGFVMSSGLLHATTATWDELHLSARMVLYPWHNDAPSKPVVVRQPQLSKTLRAIAIDGPSAFYRGAVAQDIVDTVTAQGGVMTMQDLASYKPRWRAPLTGNAFGATVLTMPQPSAGGPQLLAMSEFMAGFVKGRYHASLDTIAGAHALVEAMRHSFELRLAFSGDPKQPATRLDQVYPRKQRQALFKRFDRKKATESVRIVPTRLPKHINTSHVSIIDSQGMAVSSTHTVNLHFGSGIVASKSGVWLNNELDDFSFTLKDSNAFGLAGSQANLFRPGARPVSSMSPTIVVKKGKPILVVGSPGGTRIPTAVFQVAWRKIIGKSSLLQAVDAPRLHHQAFPDEVWVERGDAAKRWKTGLQKLGHRVVEKPAWCNVQAVGAMGKGGGYEAVSDGRYDGSAYAK